MKKTLKKVYASLPLKKQAFSLLKKVWIPPRNIYQHLHFDGIIDVEVNNSRSFKMHHYGFQIENEVFWDGLENGWEKLSFRLWMQMCAQSQVILDIGANTGIYGLMAKAISPKSDVYAFEPLDFIYKKLCENVDLNNYQIHCIDKACSNFKGEAVVFLPKGAEHVTSVTVNKSLLGENALTDKKFISTIRLDEFIETNEIKRIDLIKLDVETHEPEVLEGMGKYLSMFKPTMLIEILEDEVGEEVEKRLDGLGYLYFDIDEISQIQKVDKLRKSSHFNYFVCQPDIAKKLNLI